MIHELNGKKIRIPDDIIKISMAQLGLSQEDAIQMYLEDEGYLDNAEQNALDKKAKDNRITATIHKARQDSAKKSQKERVTKEQPIKEEIITTISAALETIGASSITIENKTKIVSFIAKDGEPYTIDLKWSRNKSKEMKGEK